MAHKASVPTIMNTALQLQKRMAKLGLTLLFIATDAEQYGIYIFCINYDLRILRRLLKLLESLS